jgi:hypothetical protein
MCQNNYGGKAKIMDILIYIFYTNTLFNLTIENIIKKYSKTL